MPPKPKRMPFKKRVVENANLTQLKKRVASAPTEPGIYRWLDEEGTVLYVGKAKNLRNRLRSYVNKENGAGPWKQSFLQKIADFEVTVTNTELEALIFETNLIKELKPKYNVLMKDDKNYVYARVTVRDPFPRVESVRRIEHDGAKYFGPLSTGAELETQLTMLRSLFPFRTCSMEIVSKESEEGIPLEVECKYKDRPTPCLDFHIQKCSAPCIGRRTPEEYFKESIEGIMTFLKGDYESVRPLFEERMKLAAQDHKFELAAQFRDYLTSLDRLAGRQLVSDTSGEDSDIIAVAVLSERADVVVMRQRNGRLIGDSSFSLAGRAENASDVLDQFLPQYYGEGEEIPESVIISEEVSDRKVLEDLLSQKKGRRVRLILPERGKKSHLLQLAEKNVREKARQRELKWEAEKRNTESALSDLQKLLSLPSSPFRIEGYDISHLGGTETVGSMVVMVGGKARNDQYRSFTIRSLKSGEVDDYKSLKEVLARRLRYLVGGLKFEEAQWKEMGVTFGKARKKEKEIIRDIIRNDATLSYEHVRAFDFLVARKKDAIVGFSRILKHKGGTKEFLSLWAHEKYRGRKLGQFLCRKMLSKETKDKVYALLKVSLVPYYEEIGFQLVRRGPKVLEKDLKHLRTSQSDTEWEMMMFNPRQHRDDVSLLSKPDLLVIDGGKGQVSAVQEVLKTLKLKIPLIGLAKREEEVFVSGRKQPVFFPKDSQAKFLLMRLRDEAHRFANRHREKRGKAAAQTSALDEIPSIGDETRKKLLQRFGSISSIRTASDEELLTILSEGQLGEMRRRL
jgi:excinuclease ABC subunit C